MMPIPEPLPESLKDSGTSSESGISGTDIFDSALPDKSLFMTEKKKRIKVNPM